ncbi:MAG: hypothetical protein LUF33_05040 [Clostridiales bacterium]|nr:hypothetical protein [Clostridiales bacterium]
MNNDILSVTFMLGAILNTVNWYRHRTVKNILKIALCVGLGMMTKLSVWMVAPAIGVVFAVVFFTRLKQWKKYLGQFAAFLGVCAPLGLWWSVRNYILWGVSPSYVPMLSETNEQYVGNYSVTQRLFDFSLSQLKWVYTQFACYEGSYYEYNPTIALFKTAMFDERINDVIYPAIAISGVILFWSGVILAIIGFAAMIGFLIKKNRRISFVTKIFLLLIYVVILGSYYIFCFTYQFTCTQNIRYIIPLITLGALFVGTVPSMISGKQKYKKALRGSLYGLTALFCIYSAVTYSVIGLY